MVKLVLTEDQVRMIQHALNRARRVVAEAAGQGMKNAMEDVAIQGPHWMERSLARIEEIKVSAIEYSKEYTELIEILAAICPPKK